MRNPYFPSLIRLPPTAYEYGRPVSVYDAIVTRSNAQFMVNESCQTRIAFVTPAIDEGIDGFLVNNTGGPASTALWTQQLRHTWIRDEMSTGFDVEVAAVLGNGAGGGTMTVIARIVPVGHALFDLTAPPHWEGTVSFSGANSEGVISDQAIWVAPEPGDIHLFKTGTFVDSAVFEEGAYRIATTALMRMEVQISVPANNFGYLSEVYVREFACHP